VKRFLQPGERPWLKQLDDVSIGHGVSLLCWRSGGSNTPRYAAFFPSGRHQLLRIASGPLKPTAAREKLRAADRRRLFQVITGADESRRIPPVAESKGMYRVQPTGSTGGSRSAWRHEQKQVDRRLRRARRRLSRFAAFAGGVSRSSASELDCGAGVACGIFMGGRRAVVGGTGAG
jgi:hypothetical protein